MPEIRKHYDPEFREGAMRMVRETGLPIVEVARRLGLNPGTLGTWLMRDRAHEQGLNGHQRSLDDAECAELARLRKENSELRMERDVLCRSVVLWVKEATGGR